MYNLKKNITYSYLAVIIQIFVVIVVTRLSLNYFGTEQYGLFSIVTSIISYLTLANFGIPWAVATMYAKLDDIPRKILLIKKGSFIMIFFSLILVFVLVTISIFYPNAVRIVGDIPNNILTIARWFIFINILAFIIFLPFSLFNQVLIFSNLSYVVKILDVFRNIGNLLIIILVIIMGYGLINYALFTGVILIFTGVLYVVIFYKFINKQKHDLTKELNSCAKKHSGFDAATYKHILVSGSYFWFNGLAGVIIMSTDALVISHMLGLDSVTKYSILATFLGLGLTLISQIMNVVNPLYPQLIIKNKNKSLLKILTIDMVSILTFIGVSFSIVVCLFGKDIINIWIGSLNIYSGDLAILAMSSYFMFLMISLVPYSILVAMGEAKSIFRMTLCEAILNLPLSICLTKEIGITGVFLGSCIANGVVTVFWSLYLVQSKYKKEVSFEYIFFIKKIVVILFILIGIYFINTSDLTLISKLLACVLVLLLNIFFHRKSISNIYYYLLRVKDV
ncbi:hypothetical protein LO80_02615 [Candidatus Francisella endociliophora]|uniref:Uncharacterized protein n=1 Tax=Candidatus Francisella endociliophora TaxID=653937 RepID=A0A097EN36_9GAMM|nr:polysaccharide biosynthesis C-terminal domain-containing protein [Francisella sp. FSC1006]AIT08977.1 hypothetical protein LO80_02615 [Francisella sp. FSC1006]